MKNSWFEHRISNTLRFHHGHKCDIYSNFTAFVFIVSSLPRASVEPPCPGEGYVDVVASTRGLQALAREAVFSLPAYELDGFSRPSAYVLRGLRRAGCTSTGVATNVFGGMNQRCSPRMSRSYPVDHSLTSRWSLRIFEMLSEL